MWDKGALWSKAAKSRTKRPWPRPSLWAGQVRSCAGAGQALGWPRFKPWAGFGQVPGWPRVVKPWAHLDQVLG